MKSQSKNDAEFILDLKDKINSSKNKKSRFEGQYDEVLSSIKRKFQVSSVDEAKELITSLNSELSTLQNEFTAVVSDLKERIDT